MNRYGAAGDQEFEPGSRQRVLRNYLGITSVREAARRESDLLFDAYDRSIESLDSDARITSSIISHLHRDWLGALYPMAGKFRTVDLSKGGFTFCHALYVPEQMRRVESEELARYTPCRGAVSEAARGIAIVHSELVLIHPFREGNGRLARWVAQLMALQAGLAPPAYDLRGHRKEAYFNAMRRAFLGAPEQLTDLFALWLQRAASTKPPSPQPR